MRETAEHRRARKHWDQLEMKAARAQRGERRKRQSEIQAFAHDQLRRDIEARVTQ